MSDRKEFLRIEASRCRAAAQRTADLQIRAELTWLADNFMRLAEHSPPPGITAILAAPSPASADQNDDR